mgnify:FL=1
MAESNLRRSLALTGGSYSIFVTNPISLILLLFTVFALVGPVVIKAIKKRKGVVSGGEQ